MKNWRYKLERFMIGRNGADQLSQAIVMFGMVLYVVYFISGEQFFNICSTAALFYALFRVFSKNVAARSKENAVYMRYIQFVKTKWEYRKTHKVFLCKKCGKIVRVPKGKGRIEVTCPVCRTSIIIKS
ncbi:MAG: hypothetical protein IJ374_08055 [Lachnospiraceae bacterium]|nr:hypothetical protein [Lachnospiraceae bacterium]